MNNEPVAWMDKESNITMIGGIYPKKLKQYLNGLEARIFALETHPVKELTDEEIKFIAYPFESIYTTYDKQTDTDTVHTRFDQLGFARVILRKAQEK